MIQEERKFFKCGLYDCTVAFFRGKFQGVARLPDKGIIFRVEGISLVDAQGKLIDLIQNNSLVFDKNHFHCKVALIVEAWPRLSTSSIISSPETSSD